RRGDGDREAALAGTAAAVAGRRPAHLPSRRAHRANGRLSPRSLDGGLPHGRRRRPLRDGDRDDGRAARGPRRHAALPGDHLLLGDPLMSFTVREARAMIRKAVRRVPEGETAIAALNLTAMMDMITILLIFLIE